MRWVLVLKTVLFQKAILFSRRNYIMIKEYATERMHSLDFLKMICAFFVVYIHTGEKNGFLHTLSILAVPTYFVISGYSYEAYILSRERLNAQTRKILKLFVASFALYCVWSGKVLSISSSLGVFHEIIWNG